MWPVRGVRRGLWSVEVWMGRCHPGITRRRRPGKYDRGYTVRDGVQSVKAPDTKRKSRTDLRVGYLTTWRMGP